MKSNLKRSAGADVEDALKKQPEQPTELQPPEQKPEGDSGGLLGWMKNWLPGKDTHDDDSLREAIEELIEEKTSPMRRRHAVQPG